MEVLMVTQSPVGPVERDSVRLAAVLLLAGVVVTAIAGFPHAEGPDANDHQAIFAIYAAGYIMALSGLCYLAQGWIIGSSGFSSANQLPTLLGIGLILVWTVWLLIAALRMKPVALPETTSDATT
jgi:hypothetical protein